MYLSNTDIKHLNSAQQAGQKHSALSFVATNEVNRELHVNEYMKPNVNITVPHNALQKVVKDHQGTVHDSKQDQPRITATRLEALLSVKLLCGTRWNTTFSLKELPQVQPTDIFVPPHTLSTLSFSYSNLPRLARPEMTQESYEKLKAVRLQERQLEAQKKNELKHKRKREPLPVIPSYKQVTPPVELKPHQKAPEFSSLFDTGPYSLVFRTKRAPPKAKISQESKPETREKVRERENREREMREKEREKEREREREVEPPVELEDDSKPRKRRKILQDDEILSDPVRHELWTKIARTDILVAFRERQTHRRLSLQRFKIQAVAAQDEIIKRAQDSLVQGNQANFRAKKLSSKISTYLRKNEGKAAEQRRKRIVAEREKERQQKKLNYLLTRTELYSHFMAKRIGSTEQDSDLPAPPAGITNPEEFEQREAAIADVNKVLDEQVARMKAFDQDTEHHRRSAPQDSMEPVQSASSLPTTAPTSMASESNDPEDTVTGLVPQPALFKGHLKTYQRRGLTWLVNLYEQGINGILADEMGLGKTVQTIAFMVHLAEAKGIWGPFLVIAPKSTLPNWCREVNSFTESLKVLPYWGNVKQRTVLRKFLSPKYCYSRDASFHVLVTSYSLIVQDIKWFKKIKWEYMILDEAQAIKSANSTRWNTLLSLKECRNRLLLTGTPIQNNMAELWALLHFIMPSLFDNHQEFADWFSKDIENHAENKAALNRHQLNRLYMVLKPFMLRRVKKEVLDEMPPKTEIELKCSLTTRQEQLYRGIKEKMTVAELLDQVKSHKNVRHLLNLVMQFRKVCNHPEILDRRKERAPFRLMSVAEHSWIPPFTDHKEVLDLCGHFSNPITYSLPKLVYREGTLPSNLPERARGSSCGFYDKWMFHRLSIFSQHYICESQRPASENNDKTSESHQYLEPRSDCWSFLRFVDLSPAQVEEVWSADNILARLNIEHQNNKRYEQFAHLNTFSGVEQNNDQQEKQTHLSSSKSSLSCARFLISEVFDPLSPASLCTSSVISKLVTSDTLRLKENSRLLSSTYQCYPSVVAPPIQLLCSDRSLSYQYTDFYDNLWAKKFLLGKNILLPWDKDTITDEMLKIVSSNRYTEPTLLGSTCDYTRALPINDIRIPNFRELVRESGKMRILDVLLRKLKRENHRVLIYSQMTKMLDLLQDFVGSCGYKFVRLDGSSRLEDRAEVVDEFQNNDSVFVFLLSTRAGGLGINLTGADTVIFYDSDWNPTIDSQAMDRAHRLGQTRPVTVYRLITKKTVEERIMQRAKQKAKIQNLVIEGGNFEMSEEGLFSQNEVLDLLIEDEGGDNAQSKQENVSKGRGFVFGPKKRQKKVEETSEENKKKKKRSKSETNDDEKKKSRKQSNKKIEEDDILRREEGEEEPEDSMMAIWEKAILKEEEEAAGLTKSTAADTEEATESSKKKKKKKSDSNGATESSKKKKSKTKKSSTTNGEKKGKKRKRQEGNENSEQNPPAKKAKTSKKQAEGSETVSTKKRSKKKHKEDDKNGRHAENSQTEPEPPTKQGQKRKRKTSKKNSSVREGGEDEDFDSSENTPKTGKSKIKDQRQQDQSIYGSELDDSVNQSKKRRRKQSKKAAEAAEAQSLQSRALESFPTDTEQTNAWGDDWAFDSVGDGGDTAVDKEGGSG